MDWQDQGLVLSCRAHGENGAIIEVLTAHHGRHLGVVRGGLSRRMQPHLQPGNTLALRWQARLSDHLGSFQAEPLRARAGVLGDRLALAALTSATALLHLSLPEREDQPRLFAQTEALFDALDAGAPDGGALYALWELALLDAIGAGLDLQSCAVTGARTGLAFVSPRSGRAVSRQGAGDWADRLLPLPGFVIGQAAPAPGDVTLALQLTGYFLTRGLEPVLEDRPLPEARARLLALIARSG